jgi:formate hydrogenlyase subunit 6/NADH:ubiquinone oxidoreductase subunit I
VCHEVCPEDAIDLKRKIFKWHQKMTWE